MTGSLSKTHVWLTTALKESVRVTIEAGGIIFATVIEGIRASSGYKAEMKRLEAEGLVELVSVEPKGYTVTYGDKAMLVILEKPASA